jgi:methylmalonyl-CoA epimerase
LNHIGFAVSDRSQLQKCFEILGLCVSHTEAVPSQGVMTYFMKLPLQQGSLELLEATDPQGVIAQFIQKKGPGIHHLSFELKKGSLSFTSQKLIEAGYKLVYPEARDGAHAMRVNFIHPSTTGGVLIEIMEQK